MHVFDQWAEIVGAIDVAPTKVGKDLGEIIGLDHGLGITVSDNIHELCSKTPADVVVHTTFSYLSEIYDQLTEIVKNHVNIVSTCEELSFPFKTAPELAHKLDQLAILQLNPPIQHLHLPF